ncbi:dihydroorotate dehydrogenase electron transfer subunit [Bacillus sp. DTU_2020_1000418_1_SI_GHA_SEK_038]|uniref:dihydroorotate dehydrogenase electron transfer subunit n=1 Tax=Bacillus sp. DTU_2020_1000418_1_SI_GHA_SEK_038 TaxID=3077585 RepID=UPI0028EAA74D|nr:dihydroorotate dehydrogenase electron transfer subunit [Bacillus sp. DTU_2020_1000418_1_SI_GHA_SEK_038]WNS76563.1 dihydroorotate dehydrogenase electron transfer subunit [Bacillus sp. DTU_2020_1000418_1_SI_GHA_SEK_038]
MESRQVRIISNVKVSDRYWHMIVDTSGMKETVEPGQFFNLLCDDGLYPFLRRPLSVYRINSDSNTLEFLYLTKGIGTKKMTELHAGGKIDIFGPLGTGFKINDSEQAILLLARGVGIATLAALAYKAIDYNKRVIAILSARSQNDLLAADFLTSIGVTVFKVTDEEGTSEVTKVEKLVNRILIEYEIHALYTCGSKRLARLMQNVAKREGLPGEIALEEHMGCAMGVCFACVCNIYDGNEIKSARVCVEGPVFPLEQVVL